MNEFLETWHKIALHSPFFNIFDVEKQVIHSYYAQNLFSIIFDFSLLYYITGATNHTG